jgi:hypothetical protein
VGSPVTDLNAGLLAAVGIVSAYVHRLKTGRGQFVDTSLLEAGIHQTAWHAAITFATGQPPGPLGSAHVLAAPYQAFPTADGWINIGGASQANWERIAKLLDVPELIADPRFHDNSARMAHRGEHLVTFDRDFRKLLARGQLTLLEPAQRNLRSPTGKGSPLHGAWPCRANVAFGSISGTHRPSGAARQRCFSPGSSMHAVAGRRALGADQALRAPKTGAGCCPCGSPWPRQGPARRSRRVSPRP